MAPLAQAFIRLRSDSSYLAGDVRRDATKAGAEGGAVMGREFGTAFRRVSRTLIGLGIGTFVVEAGRFAIDMADKFELSRSRLETVTQNLGGDFSAVSGQVQALDDRLAAFGFTNADVEGSVASLETATKSSAKAMKDAALAADIARGRNISLEEATSILMRVETGHVAMLSRLGIQVKDASGNILTQKEALQQLAATYGGAASHFAETFAGKQQALRAELGNSAAEIGVALLPAVVDLAKVLQHDILPAVQSSAEFFDRNRKTIEPLVGIVLKLALAYKAVKLAQKGLAAISVARGAGAAAGAATVAGGESALGLEAFSLAHPLPVLVVNQSGGVKPGGAVVTPAEEAAGAGGAGIFTRLLPTATEGLLKIAAPVFAAFEAYKLQQNVRAGQKSGGVLGTVGAGASSLGHLIGKTGDILGIGGGLTSLGSLLGIAGHANKVGAQQSAITSVAHSMGFLGNVTHIVTTAEHNFGGAVGKTTLSLHAQYKALTNHQAKALALSQGMDDLRSAVHNMAVTVGGGSRALKGNSDAALANRDALRGAVSQAENYLTTLKQHGASAHHVADVEVTLSKAIKHNADETYGDRSAVHALLKQLGFLPGQLQTVATAFDLATGAQDVFSTHTEQLAQRGIFGPAAKKKAKDAGGDLGGAVGAGYSHVVDKSVADASKKAADAAKAAFDAAKSKMQADVSTFKGFFSSQRESLISSFGSLNLSPRTDSFGDSGPAASFKSQLRQQARQMDTFVHLYKRLSGEGLDERLLLQIEGLGPDAIPAMRQLLQSGRKGVRQVNRLERRISRDATTVAAADTSAKFGNQMHADLEKLPHKLAVEMRKELPKAVIKVSLEDIGRRRAKRIRTS